MSIYTLDTSFVYLSLYVVWCTQSCRVGDNFKRFGFLPEDVSFTDTCQKQDNNSDWSHVINCNDVEVAYNNFVNIYEKLYNESCPVQSRKNVAKKNWMTPALLKSRWTKEKLFKKYQGTPTNENKQNYPWAVYCEGPPSFIWRGGGGAKKVSTNTFIPVYIHIHICTKACFQNLGGCRSLHIVYIHI